METANQQLTKEETLNALGIVAKTLTRWIKKEYFPGPSINENGAEYWTMRQVEQFNDWPGGTV